MPGNSRPRKKRPPPRRVPARPSTGQSTRARPAVRWMAAVLVLGLGAALIISLAAGGNSTANSPTVITAAGGAPCTADTQSDPGRNHVRNPTYTVNPPAGGDHLPVPARAGDYSLGVIPPDGQLVHSLEHGYVDLWYQPTLPADQLSQLQTVASQYSRDTLLIPRPSLPVPVAATAWHQRLLCQGMNSGALASFIVAWRKKGPERIPH